MATTYNNSWRHLSAFERDLLVDLKHAESPRTGMELCGENEHVKGRKTSSSAYRHLETLEAAGYIDFGWRNGSSKEWELTDQGEILLEAVVVALQTGEGL